MRDIDDGFERYLKSRGMSAMKRDGRYVDSATRFASEIWNASRSALRERAEPVTAPDLHKVIYHFRDLNEGFPVERFKADYVISWMLANYPPAPVVPEGWEPCSPEWIERNGPCSCAEAPRIAFGPIGDHYHPHLWQKSAPVVPDETFDEWSRRCEIQLTLCRPEFREVAEITWNACCAAMLNQK